MRGYAYKRDWGLIRKHKSDFIARKFVSSPVQSNDCTISINLWCTTIVELIYTVVATFRSKPTNLQWTVELHLSFIMELSVTRAQLWDQRQAITAMMVLSWRERWRQYAEQMGDGTPLQSAGDTPVMRYGIKMLIKILLQLLTKL